MREGRDLACDQLWQVSAAIARAKRQAAASPLRLPRTRRASLSLVVAAVAAATPSLGHAHTRPAPKQARAIALASRTVLEAGDRGRAVAALQRALGITVDRVFGPRTEKAVRGFQKRAGLEVDGRVGPDTRRAINAFLARQVPPGRVLQAGDEGRAVARLQRALRLPADGVFGPRTRKAVRAFQKRAGLEVDGVAGPATLRALNRAQASRALGRAQENPVLRRGDEGRAVTRLQRALRLPADGVFGPRTRKAVRAFQQRAGLRVDGIVGPGTWAALARGGRKRTAAHVHAGPAKAVAGFDAQLAEAIALAKRMDLEIVSGYRPGATIAASGGRSDHAVYPSKAVDVHGSASEMERYARAVAGLTGVQTVIYSGVGLWMAGRGWGAIGSSVTYRDHIGHVHVDTF
jgi:peptidoglycan hydrolase-like protein with peptidoglycan-binding domain